MRELATLPDKYVVRAADGSVLMPGTYFVIRSSDLFSTAGLWAYAHCLETVIEFAAQAQCLPDEQAVRLRELADQAAQLAEMWQRSGQGRIPD